MKEEERYTIGQMAELCGISKRILRYYDQNGIVVPACRDKDTNYRYYTKDQVRQILFLQELRELAVPVKTISRLFPDRDLMAFESELELHLQELRHEILDLQSKYDRTLDVFLRVVRGRAAVEDVRKCPDCQIQVVHFRRRMVVFSSRTEVQDPRKLYLQSRTELMKSIADQQTVPTGSTMAFFPGRNTGEMELFVEVQGGKKGAFSREQDAFVAVSCVCTGSYDNLDGGYRAMEQYAQSNGIVLKGTAVEEYLVDSTMTSDPGQYVTRLYLPIGE